ncbi:MAG: hypothetical protein FK730_17085, partial [Asgard group archaeon]|nr:hypothetical protein [Asgard group archaeon]
MRQVIKISLTLLICSLILSPLIVSGNYQVTIGQTFNYDVNNAQYEVTKGIYSASGNGFQIDGHQFPNETSILIEVTAVDPPNDVDFDISSDGYVESWFSSPFGDALGVALTALLPILLYDSLGNMVFNDINDTVSQGTDLLMPVFWDVSYFDFFEDLASESTLSDLSTDPDYQDLNFYAEYEEVGNEMIFDWYFIGPMLVTTTYTLDFDVEHQVKMVYDLSTGVLQGMRMISTTTGTHSGQNLDYYMDFYIELQGYDLDDFLYGPSTPTPYSPPTSPSSTIGLGWIS